MRRRGHLLPQRAGCGGRYGARGLHDREENITSRATDAISGCSGSGVGSVGHRAGGESGEGEERGERREADTSPSGAAERRLRSEAPLGSSREVSKERSCSR